MKNTRLNYVSLLKYGAKRLLLVAAASNSLIIHRIVDIDIGKALYSLDSAANFLNSNYAGRLLAEISLMQPGENMFRALSAEFIEAVKSEGRTGRDRQFFYDGIGRLLRLPEFQTVGTLENLISVLENRELAAKITGFAESREPVVRIGSESGIRQLAGFSVISAGYRVSGSPAGGIAIIGPTRMDYSGSIAALELVRDHMEIMLDSILQ